LTNGQIEIRVNSLEDPGVINTIEIHVNSLEDLGVIK